MGFLETDLTTTQPFSLRTPPLLEAWDKREVCEVSHDCTLRSPLFLTKPETEGTGGASVPYLHVTILQNHLCLLHSHVDGFHPQSWTDSLGLPSLLQSLNSTRLSGIFDPQPHSGQSPSPVSETCHHVPSLCLGSMSQNGGHQSPDSRASGHTTLSLTRSPWTNCCENYNLIIVN